MTDNSFEKLAAEELLQGTLKGLPGCNIFMKNLEHRYTFCPDTFAQFIGLSSEKKPLGKMDRDLFLNTEVCKAMEEAETQVLESGIPRVDLREDLLNARGETKSFLTSLFPMLDNDGEIIGIAGTRQDRTGIRALETQLQQQQEALQAQSTTDALTGVYNTNFLENDLPLIYSAFARSGKSMSVMTVEADHYEELLANSGDAVAHSAVKQATTAIRSVLKRKDDILIRTSGSRFILFLFSLRMLKPAVSFSKGKSAEEIAKVIMQNLKTVHLPETVENPPHLSHSIGLVESTERELLDDLMDRSWSALSMAREKEGNHICIGSDSPKIF